MERETGEHARCLVSIIGPSGSGKSQLAKALVTALGDQRAARIPTDWYFMPRREGQSIAAFFAEPMRYDWALIDALLARKVGTDVTTPDVEFGDQFARGADTGGMSFTVRPVMITDGMAAHPAADLVVRIEAPAAARRERIAARDVRWGTTVRDNGVHLERTWAAGLATSREPDLVVDGLMPLEHDAGLTRDLIERWAANLAH